MICIDPTKLGHPWTLELAIVAAKRLRELGYNDAVGCFWWQGQQTHKDIPADDWNDAVAAVQNEIGKAMRK